MKNLLAKLNGPALKKLAIEHGEKIGLGVVLLTCLLVLILGRWRGYSHTPDELNSLATSTANNINQTDWPEKHRTDYAPVDYIKKAEDLLTALDVQRYSYTTPMSPPVYRKSEPIKEPQWEPVLYLLADQSRAILAKPPAGTLTGSELASTTGTGEALASSKLADDDKGMEFKKRPSAQGQPATGVAAAAPAKRPQGGHGEGPPLVAGDAGGYETAGLSGSAAVGEGRGIRFVAVRGVFPYERQLKKLADAIHLDFDHQAIDYLEFSDFVIQRQKAMPGPDPWKDSKWEDLNIQSALDVLNECEALAPDVLDADYTSPVFTMPLPSLVEMDWSGSLANHPALKKYELSVKEAEERMIADEEVLKRYQEEEEKKKRGSRGFATIQKDMREIRRSVLAPSRGSSPAIPGISPMGTSAMEGAMPGAGTRSSMPPKASMAPMGMGAVNPMMSAMPGGGHGAMGGSSNVMSQIMGNYNGEQGNAIGQRLKLDLVPRYLLFRYLDFDVEPGEAYRYRVKLRIYNPNFGRAPEEVEKPSIIEGETRDTDWSLPSPPVVVETDVQYFLTQVMKKAARARNEVEWNIFQWAQKEGTLLHEKLKVTFGQFIGGKTETWVLNPAAPSFKKQKDREFHADDLLVDSYGSLGANLVPADHPDLNFNAKPNAKSASLNIPDQAVVVNRFGELIAFDTTMGKQSELQIQSRVKRERDAFKHLLEQEESSTSPGGLDDYINKQQGAGGGKGGDKKSKKKKNPADARGTSSAGMMGMSMPPGSGGAGGGHGGPEDGDAGGKKSKKKKSTATPY